jgi:glucokinase
MFIGIEIGGTKLQVGVGTADGVLVGDVVRLKVDPSTGAEGIRGQLRRAVPLMLYDRGLQPDQIAALGVGFGGPVDSKAGRTIKSHQIDGWADFPLRAWFEESFGIKSVIGNDSDLAGLAEATVGAGRGAETVVYSNIGSGIGGALVRRGELYTGQGIGSMEIGHLRMIPERRQRPYQTLEGLASGWYLDGIARRILRLDSATAADLADMARKGNPVASAAWNQAVECWGVAFANVATLLCPNRIVVGGGVALQGDFLLKPLREVFRQNVFAPFADRCEVVLAELGETMVVQGALLVAAQ